MEKADDKARVEALKYEQGCVLNYLSLGGYNGWIPIVVGRDADRDKEMQKLDPTFADHNMHKPCLAQHAAFLVQQTNGDAEWLREGFYFLQAFVNCYLNHYQHKPTGLIFWATDMAIGVNNDPCTFGRPDKT